jgi:two-component system, NarL family, sensor histidine kinase UhpB
MPSLLDSTPASRSGWGSLGARLPLFWRVFATNASVLAVAATALALSPATVSFPVAATEAVVLALGLGAMLVLNFALLRRALSPLERLRSLMRGADPLRPGRRAALDDSAPELRAVSETFNEMVERLEAERRESAGRALAAQEGERARIARELHDEVGQRLTAVMLQLDRVSRTGTGTVVEAREEVRRSLEEVRSIARRLRPEALDDLGLPSALAALTNSLGRSGNLDIDRHIDRSLPPMHPECELVVYRVAQEALTNVMRHADCREARLELRRVDGAVQLEVADTGRGFELEAVPESAGIRGMRERAVLVGASLDVESRPGLGTTVRLRLPLQTAATTSS